tara:strand:+ start:52467 stop:52952 length:486 start_codon:yes stop_codon:yes gene_type:complete
MKKTEYNMERTPVKMIKILKCNDSKKWYASRVGDTIEYSGALRGPDGSIEYRCRDNSGYINFVLGEDAVELNTIASEPYTPKLKFGKDRFDLEHEIMQCWAVVDDIDLLYKYFGDDKFFTGMKGEHADKIMNLMGGLKDLYDIKFQRMFDTFGECITNKEL